jgi:hypothetical protein
MSITKEQFEAKQNSARKEGFRRFMQEPLTRALLSTIPPCDHLEAVLEAAYQHGWGSGSVSATIHLFEAVLKDPWQP